MKLRIIPSVARTRHFDCRQLGNEPIPYLAASQHLSLESGGLSNGARRGIRRLPDVFRACLVVCCIGIVGLLGGCGGGNKSSSTSGGGVLGYTISGTVSGLSGSGLVLDNNGYNLSISGNGAFAFSETFVLDNYDVTVVTQPSNPAQTCTVANGSGTASANITNVQVTCTTTTYTIGGSVSGLSGTGLVLEDNGGNNLAITANGTFTFSTAVSSGGAYDVTVLTQPSSPAQTCTVANGSGTASANVTNVQVTCATTAATTYTIGGTVSGLSGTGLVLQDNGGDNLTVTTDGSFTFSTAIASGGAYDVTVLTQPSNPAQTCTVTDGSGMATADVTNIEVACAGSAGNEWTWVGGSDVDNQLGNYGTLGKAASSNMPGARYISASWTDTSGNLWLFGGIGEDSAGTDSGAAELNDMWKYSPSTGEWTWMGGSNIGNQAGTYGTKGVAAAGNIPGGRQAAIHWTDASGNFWLFGGGGYDSVGNGGRLNDLWKFSPSTGEWTWVSGSDIVEQVGTYGTLGKAAAGNIPGGRNHSLTWIDASGNFWLFGGIGCDATGSDSCDNYLNDLWMYDPSTNQWTWMSGSDAAGQDGTYGTEGTAAATNVPGARNVAMGWMDSSGNFWLFGGNGYDSVGTDDGEAYLNDLWKYSPTTGLWTWEGGSNIGNKLGTYGTEGTAATDNIPGARWGGAYWVDSSGNFWLLGGLGVKDSSGDTDEFNDLWMYKPSTGQWTWVGGSDTGGALPTYGTQGAADPSNVPGGRERSALWTDSSGNVWIFGGYGVDSKDNESVLNDLWKYVP